MEITFSLFQIMAPKGQAFGAPVREPRKVTSKLPDKRTPDGGVKDGKTSTSKSLTKKLKPEPIGSEVENPEMMIPEEIITAPYVTVSPRIFRKNVFHTNRLQKEIIVGKKGSFKGIEFDPALQRKAPIYLDIPNLYTRKRLSPVIPETQIVTEKETEAEKIKYQYVAEKKVVAEVKPRYIYIPRPVTPKNYNPRPKSSNRYVFVGVKRRYKEVSAQ